MSREIESPTPEQIRQRCREVQAEWDAHTEMMRRVECYRARRPMPHGCKSHAAEPYEDRE